MTVHKFSFQACSSRRTIEIPNTCKLLHVHEQAGLVCLWIELDPRSTTWPREFAVVATGEEIPRGAQYVGTAHVSDDDTVWHLYRLG